MSVIEQHLKYSEGDLNMARTKLEFDADRLVRFRENPPTRFFTRVFLGRSVITAKGSTRIFELGCTLQYRTRNFEEAAKEHEDLTSAIALMGITRNLRLEENGSILEGEVGGHQIQIKKEPETYKIIPEPSYYSGKLDDSELLDADAKAIWEKYHLSVKIRQQAEQQEAIERENEQKKLEKEEAYASVKKAVQEVLSVSNSPSASS